MIFQTLKRCQRSNRNGLSVAEVMVSSVLLVTVISITGALAFRISRIEKGTQQYQAAVDEIANQLEKIVSLDEDSRENSLKSVTVSEGLEGILPNAVFTSQELNDSDGHRITLSLNWDRNGPSEPVTLTAWIGDPVRKGKSE